jgi:hypothetical protein
MKSTLTHVLIGLALGMLTLPRPSAAYSPSSSEDISHKISVRNAIGKNFKQLAACLQDLSDEHPELKEVALEFVVWTNGKLYNVKLFPGDASSEACIEELLKQVDVPSPENPRDYSFKIDLDTHVRHSTALSTEIKKDTVLPEEKGKKRVKRHTLSLDLLTPIVTGAMGLGAVFIFEYEIAVHRYVALSFTGMAGRISKDQTIKVQGQTYDGKVEGAGGGGGGGIRVFPLGKAPGGLLFGAQVRAYVFPLEFNPCPTGATKGLCSGELKNMDLLFEAGWRFVTRFGLAVQLSAEVGSQWGRSLYQFDSDPAFYFGGRAAVGWTF